MDPTLFRPIGDLASSTDNQVDVDDNDERLKEDAAPKFELDEGEEREVQQIESMCMNCHENGVTRMLLTQIPYFREVIISSFKCDHCGYTDTEVQSAGSIQPKGCTHTVHVLSRPDLSRQIVKSPTCTILIPELSLTIPASRGQLTNIEGIISDVLRDLGMDQPVRKVMEPETYAKIEKMLVRLRDVLEGDDDDVEVAGEAPKVHYKSGEKPLEPFTLKLDDPAGNSFIQFHEPMATDTKWSMRAYSRTFAQNVALGLVAEDEAGSAQVEATTHHMGTAEEAEAEVEKGKGKEGGGRANVVDREDGTVVPEEVFSFPGSCSSCGHEMETLMQKVNIPHFKDVIIMSTNCDHCGYRDNEVKTGGAISEKGKKIILKVEDEEDLSRDLLKSETCGLEIPEIDLFLHPGTLGGRFTTLEGLLNQVYDELSTKVFTTGDAGSVEGGERATFEKFLGGLKDVMTAARPFTLILDDPVANSYLQNIYAPDPDPNMEIIIYERTHEQNEDLGINDMVLEGYEAQEEEDQKERERVKAEEGEGKEVEA